MTVLAAATNASSPQSHRRGAGMIGCAFKNNLDATNAGNRGDDADIKRLRLEYDALLNVQFEERLDVGAARGRDQIRIAADASQRLA